MRHFKSERLKKLETELQDLEQWLKLGLVPKKDLKKHEEEIGEIRAKIEEEKDRLRFLKESGDWEEYVTPKRSPARSGYTEMPTIPDIGMMTEGGNITEGFTNEDTDHGSTKRARYRDEETEGEEEEQEEATEDGESYFGSRRRWEGIIDPDADDW